MERPVVPVALLQGRTALVVQMDRAVEEELETTFPSRAWRATVGQVALVSNT
jgi:hypothetical protein